MDETPKKAIMVNHGRVFNCPSWYLFYCPTCEDSFDPCGKALYKCKCGTTVELK